MQTKTSKDVECCENDLPCGTDTLRKGSFQMWWYFINGSGISIGQRDTSDKLSMDMISTNLTICSLLEFDKVRIAQ